MHSLIFLFTSLCLPFLSLGAVNWCYKAESNICEPSTWKDNYEICGMQKQSPINIVTEKAKYESRLDAITFEGYDHAVTDNQWDIENNGHSAQVTLTGQITIKDGNLPNTYKAVQLHFHWGTVSEPGSEHTIDGKQYPMELHIVHQNQEYNSLENALTHPDGLAVLGFFFVESHEDNSNMKNLIDALKTIQKTGDKAQLTSFPLNDLILDKEKLGKYYRYSGSLTTPHCNEAVIWTLFAEAIPISRSQLKAFSETIFYSNSKPMAFNFRPVQKLNGRTVYVSDSAVRPFNAAVLSALLAVWTSILFN